MEEREIDIKLLKKQIVNDISVQCNLIGRTLQKVQETAEIASEIMTPDDEETKPIIARAMTEAFGEVKRVCQKYLLLGRDTDDNRLERINEMKGQTETINATVDGINGTYDLIAGTTYVVKIKASGITIVKNAAGKILGTVTGQGMIDYTPATGELLKFFSGDDAKSVSVTYYSGSFGIYELKLAMPDSFNLGMTETVKSCAHRMIVDYVLRSLLMQQHAEIAKTYITQFAADTEGLRDALRSRTKFTRRAADWS